MKTSMGLQNVKWSLLPLSRVTYSNDAANSRAAAGRSRRVSVASVANELSSLPARIPAYKPGTELNGFV